MTDKANKFKRGIHSLGDFLDMVMKEFMEIRSTVANAVQHADKIENEVKNLERYIFFFYFKIFEFLNSNIFTLFLHYLILMSVV